VHTLIHLRKTTVTGTRLTRPAIPRLLVWRERLGDMLDAGVRRSLTLVCAGPGWGKTTLVASWAERRSASGPLAWLTLDAQHDDPEAFWSDLVMALRLAGAPSPDDPDLPASFAGPAMLDRLRLARPVVLVLDDVQEVSDERVLDALARLVRNPPGRLRLVLISRTEPPLPLHRLRAAGELTELRSRDLAFRGPEAAELLAAHDQALGSDELSTLLRATDGWAAGLRLMLAAPSTAGAYCPAAADYLLREVVEQQPAEIRRFLLRTSVPERIGGDLADALTGGTTGRQVLEHLHRANAFLVPLDPDRHWYRYHPMLRAALRHELELSTSALLPEVHLLAAQWFARERDTMTAVEHAAAARDWPFVARLAVDQAIPLLVSADRPRLIGILERIPPDRLGASAELAICGVAVRFRGGDRDALPGQVARARALLAAQTGGPSIAAEVALRFIETGGIDRLRGDMPELIAGSTELLKLLTTVRIDQLPSVRQYRALALGDKGVGLLFNDLPDQADRYLWAASTAARIAGVQLVEMDALAHLALLALYGGAVHEADEHISSVRGLIARLGTPDALDPRASMAYLTQALLEIERNRIVEAHDAFRLALHAQGERPEAMVATVTSLVRAHLQLARDEPVGARATLRQAREDAHPGLSSPLLDRWARFTASDIDLALNEPEPVLGRYRGGALGDALVPAEQACLARAYLMIGDHAAADYLAARVREGPDRLAAITGWIVTALVADAQGHTTRSIDSLSQAVLRADADGIRRPFRRFDARRIAALVERRRWLHDRSGPAASEVLGEVDGDAPAVRLPTLTDLLSGRETDVLRYLPTVLTAAEIATSLGISVNTVKAHMRAIYRKLGAGRRREAVIRGRERGLL
jgi:LuxR family transcriptional regulator, maltose regulon positive regulatory protein